MRLGALAAVLSAFLANGCSDEATLLVDVRTDWAAGIEFVAVRTEIVDDAGAVTTSRERAALATTDFSAGARVAEIGGLDAGAVSLRVRLLDGRGVEVAEKSVRVTVRGRVAVTVVIGRACPAGMSCPSCSEDSECVPTADCAQGACTDGVCLFFARSGACAEPLYCDPGIGCVAPPGTDAGVVEPDAGSPCGAPCPPENVCDVGSGMCIDCGETGEACCDESRCGAGLVCDAGSCVSCGGDGQPCCAAGVCDGGRVCLGDDGLCRDCGGAAQPCCAGGTCDTVSLVCEGPSDVCAPCGSSGEPCCAGDRCDGGLTCMPGGFCSP